MDTHPITLTGRIVELQPLTEALADALSEVGLDESIWHWSYLSLRTPDDMRAYIATALDWQQQGTSIPFAIYHLADQRYVGSTRFHTMDHKSRTLEIGHTWINPNWQRTAVNTESKYLMLRHAFEVFQCIRVQLKTDALNEKSRSAILRMGAKQEGTFRNHMITDRGRIRDSIFFSIIDSEWPEVKANLEEKLARSYPRMS
jgi:N-acetyltransferase